MISYKSFEVKNTHFNTKCVIAPKNKFLTAPPSEGCSHKWRETNWECDSITFSNKSIIITVTLGGGTKNTNFQNSMGALSNPISFAIRISKQFLFSF